MNELPNAIKEQMLQSRVNELEADKAELQRECARLVEANGALSNTVNTLRKALEKYAKQENWMPVNYCASILYAWIAADGAGWEIARDKLEATK